MRKQRLIPSLGDRLMRRLHIVLLGLLIGLYGSSAIATKTLVFCSESSPEGFNPQLFTTANTMDASSVPLYNRLVQFELGSTNIVPALATAWDISPDGLRYTFTLRQGVKFHSNAKFKPTRDFNADDVLFSYNRMALDSHPFHKLSAGQTYAYFNDMGLNQIVERLDKIDAYTVRFTLKHPVAPFLADLAMDFASILSAEYAATMAAAGTPAVIDRQPIGTGPFQFVSYQKDAVIRYKAFDQAWSGRPKLDNLIFAITPDASVRYAKLKANECQIMSYPKLADLPAMRADKNITLLNRPGLDIGFIAFNVEKKPFDNKLVRQALNMAVDKQGILNTVFLGAGSVAKNPIPPTIWSYNAHVKDYPYDPVQAKALLAKAGYPNGFNITLWYLSVNRPYNPAGKRMAELIQADWGKIGVKTSLITYEWGEYIKRVKNGEHQAAMYGWSSDNGDPDNFFTTQLGCHAVSGGGNIARWCNQDYEALIQKALLVSSQAERSKLYQQAQVIAKEQAPWITIAHSMQYTPMRKEVIGYKMSATVHHYFDQVDLLK